VKPAYFDESGLAECIGDLALGEKTNRPYYLERDDEKASLSVLIFTHWMYQICGFSSGQARIATDATEKSFSLVAPSRANVDIP
jgi:hypothetical protein